MYYVGTLALTGKPTSPLAGCRIRLAILTIEAELPFVKIRCRLSVKRRSESRPKTTHSLDDNQITAWFPAVQNLAAEKLRRLC